MAGILETQMCCCIAPIRWQKGSDGHGLRAAELGLPIMLGGGNGLMDDVLSWQRGGDTAASSPSSQSGDDSGSGHARGRPAAAGQQGCGQITPLLVVTVLVCCFAASTALRV